jgi:hypothetical protein
MGMWAEALRETARALAREKPRLFEELPRVARPGGRFDARVLEALVRQRNLYAHEEGGLTATPEECHTAVRESRPLLEEALEQIQFVCAYPLGFVQKRGSGPGGARFYLHSCMGARIADTAEAYVLETRADLQDQLPFVVTPDGTRLLYLWPLLTQRVATHTGRHTLLILGAIR